MGFINKTLKVFNILLDRNSEGEILSIKFDSSKNVLIDGMKNVDLQCVARSEDSAVNNAFVKAITIIPFYDDDLENRVRVDVFLMMARNLGYFAVAAKSGEAYVAAMPLEQANFKSDMKALSDKFEQYFDHSLSISSVFPDEFKTVTQQGLKKAEDFFLKENGDWISNFMENLGDDISRFSFSTYIIQRISAMVIDNADIAYPVAPPLKTSSWRAMREQMKYNFPKLFDNDGTVLRDLFFKYIFVYDQYSIENVVEAQPGDTVADIGAFIGDTSCYFSRKIGPSGKVIAFEISPKSVEVGRKNMIANGCNNVEYVQKGISDKIGELHLNISSDASKNSIRANAEDANGKDIIHTITLDAFCEQTGNHINFIKADIEGSEMSLLRGAQKTILNDAPTCAICVYHKKNDFFEIPNFLKNIRPDYKFYFRCEAEPVVFAKAMNK